MVRLYTRAFPPRLGSVEDIANQLLRVCNAPPVGKRQVYNFVKRQPELQTRYMRRYNYQRAKCEDLKVISEWFALVQNVKAKYSIVDNDIYNFDKTGFIIGIIFAGMVVTTSDSCRKAKLTQPGNCEWATVIQGVNAIGQAIPLFIILAAQYYLANWYTKCNLLANQRIATTDNSQTTNIVSLDWIKHFDFYIAPCTRGKYRLLILDSYKSHYLTEFELYCQQNNIITLYIPLHSSHLLQLLDVGCFRPLKQVYSRQVKDLIHVYINYISKLEFLYAFREAFFASITERNIQGGFAGAGLVLFDLERVLSKLDVRLCTLTPLTSQPSTTQPWVFQTPYNPREANSQSTLIKTRIASHQNSSPTSMLAAVDQLTKGTMAVMHQVALLRAENALLCKANEALSKRRRAKRTHVQLGGSLAVQDAQEVLGQGAVGREGVQETQPGSGSTGGGCTKVRCCGIYGKPSYNARTCQEVIEASDSAASNIIIVSSQCCCFAIEDSSNRAGKGLHTCLYCTLAYKVRQHIYLVYFNSCPRDYNIRPLVQIYLISKVYKEQYNFYSFSFYYIIYQLYYQQQYNLVILLEINKGLKVLFYNYIKLFYLPVYLQVVSY